MINGRGRKINRLLIGGGHRIAGETFPDSSDPRTLVINDGALTGEGHAKIGTLKRRVIPFIHKVVIGSLMKTG